ncbi:hypothetical protein [Candidatus Gullanella endobia]|uniref:hypothetical protein n=1 Tax=Candidatus Gullanella endobia TaxID=1070130 RepID=UPI00131545D4|nr:hypothetical protein [Candidatus Gullanella endobia]
MYWYLRHRLVDYHYLRNFGGVYYIFLRGIEAVRLANGIVYCLLNSILINELDIFIHWRKEIDTNRIRD